MQDLFSIDAQQMQILTNLTSDEPDILANINQYVGGIFVQMTYNTTDKKTSYDYYKAVDCE